MTTEDMRNRIWDGSRRRDVQTNVWRWCSVVILEWIKSTSL